MIGEIIKRFEDRGLQLIAMKLRIVSREFAEEHYAAHKGKKFYNGLIKYITSSPIIAMVWEGSNAVEAIRQTIGSTNPIEAAPGTIRHDMAIITSRNLVHASDSFDTAKKEISLWKNEKIDTNKEWYISSGNGMAATLKIASEKGCYTLTDMSTYLHLKDKLNLDIKVDNDQNLINEYSVMTINPDKNKMINYKNAKIFMNWITSNETKKLISTYSTIPPRFIS